MEKTYQLHIFTFISMRGESAFMVCMVGFGSTQEDSMFRPIFVFLAAATVAVAAPSPGIAQEGPADVFRAYWASGLSPADPELARFRSRASLEGLAALLAGDPEMAADILDFMAAMHEDLQSSADIDTVEVVAEEDDRTTLEVRLKGRHGPLRGGLPSLATVEMVREADGWKVHSEAYSGGELFSSPADPASPSEAEPLEWEDTAGWEETCPAESTLGDPAAPHILVLHGPEGEGRVHFSDARLLLNEGWLIVELPVFNEHRLSIRAAEAGHGPGSFEGSLTVEGLMGFGGCPTLPARFIEPYFRGQVAPEGQVAWDSEPGSGRANVTFSIPDPATGRLDLSGALQDVPVADISPGPLLEGSAMLFFGEEVAPTRGTVLHEPDRARLEISLDYDAPSGSGGQSILLEEFSGEPGYVVEDRGFGKTRVTLVREFDGTLLDLEVRNVPEDEMGDADDLAERFPTLGELVARVRTDRVATLPTLRPVER